MDPYIEACGLWEDFHDDLIVAIKTELARAVPEHYLVRTGERAYIVLAQPEGKDDHGLQTDMGVTTRTPPPPRSTPAAEGEPVTLRALIATEYRETFIEIYELHPERRLITCLEALSPSNKRRATPGWEQYLRKRQGLLLGEASLVEIDLLRGGQRLPMIDPWPSSPYTLLVGSPGTGSLLPGLAGLLPPAAATHPGAAVPARSGHLAGDPATGRCHL